MVFFQYYDCFSFLVFKKTIHLASVGFPLFWVLAFFVKVPMFGFHRWLPVAHGEAPTFGRMVLGAIILKLGMVGLFRVFPFTGLIGDQLLAIIR